MRLDAEINANRFFSRFEAVEYKTQVVAGRNYFVKVGGAMTELCSTGVCLLETDRLSSTEFLLYLLSLSKMKCTGTILEKLT